MQNDITLYNTGNIAKINSENEVNYTTIEINKKSFAIETEYVMEIFKIPELECPSNMPAFILGFFEYRQKHIPVIDLRQIFNEDVTTYDINSEIVILKTNENEVSIICDRVLDILKFDKRNIQNVPYQNQKNFFEGIYINNNENPYILNIESLLEYINSNKDAINSENKNEILINETTKPILEERKNFLKNIAQNIQNITPIFNMGVSFKIDNIKYYVNMANVKEFFKLNNTKITKLPCVPDFITGLVNIKGEFITILDIRKFYDDVTTTIKEKSTIIIINSDEFKIGILADEILESMNINFNEIIQNKLQKQDEDKLNEFVKNEEIYQVLDIEKLLQDKRLTVC